MATETENDRPTDWLTGRLGRHRAKRAHGGSPLSSLSLSHSASGVVRCVRARVRAPPAAVAEVRLFLLLARTEKPVVARRRRHRRLP